MKKNLLSILILVLLIVNIAMTAVMMISVTGTNRKTAELITPILSALNLELYNPDGSSVTDVPLSETDTYVMTEMMIPLASSINEDGTVSTKQNYIIFTPSLLQNEKHKDYKKLGGEENMTAADSIVKDIFNTVVSQYTLEECRDNFDRIREEILKEIQSKFDSNFIYQIAVNGVKFG